METNYDHKAGASVPKGEGTAVPAERENGNKELEYFVQMGTLLKKKKKKPPN